VRGEKKTGDAYELIITSMNTVVNLSSPLVTRLASSIQLGRREREREEQHMMLFLFNRAEQVEKATGLI
jgi:hypothetical protein